MACQYGRMSRAAIPGIAAIGVHAAFGLHKDMTLEQVRNPNETGF
jgi:hypothetical protein